MSDDTLERARSLIAGLLFESSNQTLEGCQSKAIRILSILRSTGWIHGTTKEVQKRKSTKGPIEPADIIECCRNRHLGAESSNEPYVTLYRVELGVLLDEIDSLAAAIAG